MASPEPALARWFAHGGTSLTHPLLRQVQRVCFEPLGIESDWLEAEPFSSLESGLAEWWLRAPHWNPARFDRSHPAASDFARLLDHPEDFAVGTSTQGILSLAPAPASAARKTAATDYLETMEDGWRLIRHTVQASQWAETLIYAAAGSVLANDPAADLFARGDDDAFFAAIRERSEKTESGPARDKAAATPPSGDKADGPGSPR